MPAKIFEGRLFTRSTSNKLVSPHPFSGGKKGFTLIELLVVLAVIGILATIILANYNDFGARQEVRNAAAELKTNLRKYQTFAFASQKNPDQSGDCTGTQPPDNTLRFYAVVVGTDPALPAPYLVFLDCTLVPNKILTDQSPWSDNVVLEEVGYYDGTTFSSQVSIDIEFLPVNEGVNLESPDGVPVPAGSSVYIRLTNNDSSATYNVFVTNAGRIYEERQ
jgi:prepilin-type N-terminal cleavage/methylation domain-containing protein